MDIEQAFYLAVILLAFLAQALKEMGIPSPGLTQSLLVYAGYQLSIGSLSFGLGIILFTLLGGLCGAALPFALSRSSGDRFTHWLKIRPEALEKARQRLYSASIITVCLGRSIPGLMVPTSLAAGTLKIPTWKFLCGVTLSTSSWILALAVLGDTLHSLRSFFYR